VSLVDKVSAGNFGSLLIASQIYVDLTARATWTGFAHFPEVVLLVSVYYPLGREILQPGCFCLGILAKSVFFVTLKNGCIKAFLKIVPNYQQLLECKMLAM
jgi:hypothetical protein